ncbi:hypothetical protein ACFYXC_35840 [Streptomyces sp. NPDC002701]|uniref:hypothetical protein n=1 Tax=Streptomyces sp. NPDC002701 TaxID=3364661 RepID=UPI00367AD9D4
MLAPTPVAVETDEAEYPPIVLASMMGAFEAFTAVPSISTGTLMLRLWYVASTGFAT